MVLLKKKTKKTSAIIHKEKVWKGLHSSVYSNNFVHGESFVGAIIISPVVRNSAVSQ